ncbi:MAG: signal peptidase I [Candidatus Portnoybacteria bacterium]|nr:signal peptidase I [Candidatus Portnoybacteria bacterium]
MNQEKDKSPILKHWLNFTWEILKIVIISLAIVIPIRYFLIQPFFVKGASMDPTFLDGDYLIIDEISYRFTEPERGDVIIFKYPLDTSQFFIKRIIGLPGETVRIENGRVHINSEELEEEIILDESEYLSNTKTPGNIEIRLEEDEYFVLGDNRRASSDSRKWGELEESYIIGKAWIRAWPINRLEIIE